MKRVELEQFLHAFTSRGFDSISWAFLLILIITIIVPLSEQFHRWWLRSKAQGKGQHGDEFCALCPALIACRPVVCFELCHVCTLLLLRSCSRVVIVIMSWLSGVSGGWHCCWLWRCYKVAWHWYLWLSCHKQNNFLSLACKLVELTAGIWHDRPGHY